MASSATVESLELRISNKAEGVASGIRDISAALKEMKLAARGGAGLADVVNQLNAFNAAMRRTRALTKTKIQIPINAKNLQNAVGNIKNTTASATQKLTATQSIASGGVEEGAVLDSVSGKVDAVSTKTKAATKALTEYQKTMQEMRQKSLELTLQSKELTIATKEVNLELANMRLEDKIAKQAEKATSKLAKFTNMLKRILLYRVLRSVISEIGQAMKEGIQNAYEWSKLNDGQFAQSMDTLASCAVQLKNALGAIAVPIIQLVTPAIQAITKVVVELANAISWLWSVITGAGTYMKVSTDYMTEYAGATKKAGKAAGSAAKEMRTILGFDEINKLNGDNGGGGGGGSGTDYGSMFSVEPADFSFNLLEAFKKLIDSINGSIIPLRENWNGLSSSLAESTAPITKTKTTLERLREAATNVYEALAEGQKKQDQTMEEWARNLSNRFVMAKNRITEWVLSTSTALNTWSVKVYNNVTTGMKNVVTSIKERLESARAAISQWATNASTAFENFRAAVANKMSLVGSVLTNAKNNVVSWASATAQRMNEWSGNVAKSVSAFASSTVTNIYNGLLTAGNNIVNWTKTTSDNIRSWASTSYNSIVSWATNMAKKVADACRSAYDSIKSFLNATNQGKVGSYSSGGAVAVAGLALAGAMSAGGGKSFGMTKNYTNTAMAYATGGFPTPGDLFIANERGAELVGSMNNRPAVANQDQIIEGISQGVARAMLRQEALLKEQNELLRTRGDVTITTGSLVNAFDRMNRRSGTAIVPTGG